MTDTSHRHDGHRHEGPLLGANAIGEAGSLDSGPGVRVMLRVDLDRRILAAAFVVARFDAARGAASEICEVLEGASLDDAARITAPAVARLAGLDDGCTVARQVHFALRDALRPWLEPTAQFGADIVCACFGISRGQILETINNHCLRTIEGVRSHLPATQGCATCLPDVERLLSLKDAEED